MCLYVYMCVCLSECEYEGQRMDSVSNTENARVLSCIL